MGKKRKRQNHPAPEECLNYEEILTDDEGCIHYKTADKLPWDCHKYFSQRYSIFSLYDGGIRMTEDAWFGVTPEPVANKLAQHIASAAPSTRSVIIDAFAGVGGNSIAFALSGRWKRVYAIEKDAHTLSCARKNASIYGVADAITFIEGDCFEVLRTQLAGLREGAVVFGSPPWGGPGYRGDKVFDVSLMRPYNLEKLVGEFRAFAGDVALYLPRSSDLRQVARCGNGVRRVTVVHYCMQGASKALCVYFGDLKVERDGGGEDGGGEYQDG